MTMYSQSPRILTSLSTMRILLILTVLVDSTFFVSPIHAAPLSQDDDPVAQCAEGARLFDLSNPTTALELLEAGFAGRNNTTFTNPDDLGKCAYHLGLLRQVVGNLIGGLEAHEFALNVFRDTGNQYYAGYVLIGIGSIKQNQGRWQEALNAFEEALLIHRSINETRGEAYALNHMGLNYKQQSEYDKALSSLEQALIIFKKISDQNGEANVLLNISQVYIEQSSYDDAIRTLQRALEIFKKNDDRIGQANVLASFGGVYSYEGRHPQALEYYQQALTIYQEAGNKGFEAIILHNIGDHFISQGNYIDAALYFQQAIILERAIGNRYSEVITQSEICSIYIEQGHTSKAIDCFQQVLAIDRDIGNLKGEAQVLASIGGIYVKQGRYTDALSNFQDALLISREIGDRFQEAKILNRLGDLYTNQKNYDAGLESYLEAREINKEIKSMNGEASALNGIGLIYRIRGSYSESLNYFQQALVVEREVVQRVSEANTLMYIGLLCRDQKKYDDALDYLQQALDIYRAVGSKFGEANSLMNIGIVYEDQIILTLGDSSNPNSGQNNQDLSNQSIHYYQQAIEIIETLRSEAGNEDSRVGFASQYNQIYSKAINLYHKQGRDEEAFFISEQGRARTFLDSISTGYIELTDNSAAELIAQEQETYFNIQILEDKLIKAKTSNLDDSQLVTDLDSQVEQKKIDYSLILKKIQDRQDYLESLVPARSTVLTLEQVQGLLDDNTTLISYWVLDDQTLAFVITKKTFVVQTLVIGKDELTSLITSFLNFSNLQETHPESMAQLYNALITPLKEHLNTPHLTIMPHGILNYIPFNSLSDGKHYLIDDYVITYIPSASSLSFVQKNVEETKGQTLLIGNPLIGEYDTALSLVTEAGQLRPLLYAETEVMAIGNQLAIEPFVERNATETLVKQRASQVKILHLAAHGLFNPSAPLSSLIALAPDEMNDGWLTAGEVYGLDLNNSDLVVLSACNTQTGKLTDGDDFIGLTRAFFFAGAPTVVSSLWSVDDQTTALLMERFYTHMQAGIGKAEALRQAQIDVREQYPNPYYWAAFVLNGDAGKITEIKHEEADATQMSTQTPTLSQFRFPNCGIWLSFMFLLFTLFCLSKKRKKA